MMLEFQVEVVPECKDTMFATGRRTTSVLLIALFSCMALTMVFTCQGYIATHHAMDATDCHHSSSTTSFSCCLAAVLPVEIGRLPALPFFAWSNPPVLLKQTPFSFPFFIPPRTVAS
jgi:hypothetical protein